MLINYQEHFSQLLTSEAEKYARKQLEKYFTKMISFVQEGQKDPNSIASVEEKDLEEILRRLIFFEFFQLMIIDSQIMTIGKNVLKKSMVI